MTGLVEKLVQRALVLAYISSIVPFLLNRATGYAYTIISHVSGLITNQTCLGVIAGFAVGWTVEARLGIIVVEGLSQTIKLWQTLSRRFIKDGSFLAYYTCLVEYVASNALNGITNTSWI